MKTRLLTLVTLLISMEIAMGYRRIPKWNPNKHQPTVAANTKEDPSFYRLPNSTYPLEYDLKFVLDPEVYDYLGETRIKIMATEQTNQIVLHADYDMDYSSMSLTDSNGTMIPITSEPDKEREFLIITLSDNRTLSVGQQYELEFSFSNGYSGNARGIYLEEYEDAQGTIRYFLVSSFLPTTARNAFPCYDEPALKAVFNIHIYYPTGYNALSNMDAIASTQPPMENFNVTSFRSTPLMSTYLVAFTVTEYTYKSNTEEGNVIFPKEYRLYSRPDANDMLDFPLEFGQKNLLYLQEYIGVDYRLPKVDNIAFPYFFVMDSLVTGSLENWGLVTYDDNYMLYKKGLSTSEEQMLVARSMSHGNSLFWFGNEVTPEWWDHLWVSGGFATYFEFYSADKVLNWRLMEQFVVNELQNVLYEDSFPFTNPMNNEVGSWREISDQFNSIAFYKAGSVIRMMQNLMGEELFHAAVTSYVKRLQGGVTRPEYLYEELQKSIDGTGIIPSNTNISSIISSWADQKGYPIVTITPGADSTTLVVKQERFHYNMSTHSDEKWWIPFTWTTSSNASFDTARPTMISPDATVYYIEIDAGSWYIANLQQSGFYRVMYDYNNWNKLIEALNTENHTLIHPLNKAQLIDDSYMFALSDRFSFNTTLSILNYLQREVDYIPWVPAERALNFLNYKMPASGLYNEYKLFVRRLTARIYDSVGMSVQDDDDHITRRTRSLIAGLACDYGSPDCLRDAQSALAKEMNGGSPIDPDLTLVSYCYGVKNASDDLWYYLLRKFNETINMNSYDDYDYKEIIDDLLIGMACSDSNSTIDYYLQLTIDPDAPDLFRVPETIASYVALYGGPLGVHKVLEFLQSNFIETRETMHSNTDVIDALGQVIITAEQIQAFDAFYHKYKDQFIYDELDHVLEAYEEINKRQQWIRDNMGDIDSWIIENA